MDKKLEYLKSIETGVVSDALELLNIKNWTNSIFPSDKDFKIVGKAFTALFTATVSKDEKTYNHYDVINMCEEGDVLVFAGAPEGRIFGSNTAVVASQKGIVGIVLDGRSRDVTEIENVPMPLFYRGPIIAPTDSQYKLTQVQVRVNCDGAMINPGDIVVGDRDGMVVIPAERLDEVIYQCEMIADVEAQMLQGLKRKAPIEELKAIIKQKKILRK